MSEPEQDEPTTICDRCATETPQAEVNDGPTGTEWEGAALCNECYAEVNHG